SSLDLEAMVGRLLGHIVPRVADWCVLELVGERAGRFVAGEEASRRPGQPRADDALRGQGSVLWSEVGDGLARSSMVVPMVARSRTVGVVTFGSIRDR